MNILIIDDDAEDTALFTEALTELDPLATCYVANTCENIQASVKILQEVDIIFIDGHMHPIDGATCLGQLIDLVDRTRTKIVIHSGSLSPEEQLALKTLGADHFLNKAPSFQMLKANISELIGKPLKTIESSDTLATDGA